MLGHTLITNECFSEFLSYLGTVARQLANEYTGAIRAHAVAGWHALTAMPGSVATKWMARPDGYARECDNQVGLRRGTGLGKLELCDALSAEAPTAMHDVVPSVAHPLQTIAW